MLRSLLAGLMIACLVAPAMADEPLPKLHRIELKDSKETPSDSWKKSISVTKGDYIAVKALGGSYPGGMINNVKVDIKGGIVASIVTKEAVLAVDQEGRVGGIELLVLLKGSAAGKAEVSLTPTGGGVQPKVYVLDVTVNDKK
ncbi:hypothetical protein [Planctomicrobium sp. SH527]|uniref:hypothetical protein n=1 Tax=Planctomicrobium sp. SH527 TaxID=3448123 RepID=UPI003F5B2087